MEGSFEARLTAKRETAAGIFLTVQIQPDDYLAELATLRVGSALMLGWAEIVNTAVEPIELDQGPAPRHGSTANGKREALDSAPANKERRPFASLPLSAQAGMRGADPLFKTFMPECLGMKEGEEYADAIRRHCGVKSRAELIEGTKAGNNWLGIEAAFQSWLTDRQYADARR